MAHSTDPALDALFLPFQESLHWPEGSVAFLRARAGSAALPYRAALQCEQAYKPDADALRAAGFTLRDESATPADSVSAMTLVLPPRQREESRALLARAVLNTLPGGYVVASVSNNEGARSAQDDLEQLTGNITVLSKHKCRVFWSRIEPATLNQTLLSPWQSLDAPRNLPGTSFISRPGVFAWDRIDPASALLVSQLPDDLTGHAADLGAGFGYLSAELLKRCAGITQLDVYEADARALALARTNLSACNRTVHYHWHDVTQGLHGRYDCIVTNPPFHTQSRADRPELGQQFIRVAANALNPGGQLWLVANRHLPYEETLGSHFGEVRMMTERDGFKIIRAIKAPDKPARHRKSHASPSPSGRGRG